MAKLGFELKYNASGISEGYLVTGKQGSIFVQKLEANVNSKDKIPAQWPQGESDPSMCDSEQLKSPLPAATG